MGRKIVKYKLKFFSSHFSKCPCAVFRRGLVRSRRWGTFSCFFTDPVVLAGHCQPWAALWASWAANAPQPKAPFCCILVDRVSTRLRGQQEHVCPLCLFSFWPVCEATRVVKEVLDTVGSLVPGICSGATSLFCTGAQWHRVVMILWFRSEIFKLFYTHSVI